jgi:hypothetical protein
MHNSSKKLMLHKETVRRLSNHELGRIAGGAASSWDSCICSISRLENPDCKLGTSGYTTSIGCLIPTDNCTAGCPSDVCP